MKEGDQARNFALLDHTGTRRTLYSFLTDGPLVLFFYPIASSPICSAEACHFRDLAAEFAAVGARRVGISTDSVDRQAHFAQQRSFDFPLLSDVGGSVAEQFGAKRSALAKLTRTWPAASSGRHARHRDGWLTRIATRRKTFVIDENGTVCKIVSNDLRANIHADQALWYLRTEYRKPLPY